MKIVLLARDCDSSMIVYNFLDPHFTIDRIVIEKTWSKRKRFRKRIKLIGLSKAIGQVLFMMFIFPFLKRGSQKRKNEILEQHGMQIKHFPADKIIYVDSLSSEHARSVINELNPDLLIVNGTRIISGKTLSSVQAPFINIHTGITPAFRGVHGGYWAMAKNKKELFGTTIHYVDPGVDTGGIIGQVFIMPDKHDNFYTYPYLQYAAVLPVLKNVVQQFADGNKPAVKSPMMNESALWFHPTILQWIKNIGRTLAWIGMYIPVFL